MNNELPSSRKRTSMARPNQLSRRVQALERAIAPAIDARGIHVAILAGELYPGAGDPRADRLARAIEDMLERSQDIFPNRPPPDEATFRARLDEQSLGRELPVERREEPPGASSVEGRS